MESNGALPAIIRQQWIVCRRDRRLHWMGAILLLACLTALVSGVVRNERMAEAREVATRDDVRAWKGQGETNPHYAAHFGRYAFKPISLLSAFDPGLLDHLGTMVRLEAHRQNLATGRAGDSGNALSRFSSLSVASALQILAPLLIILLAFTTFSGGRVRSLLRQELGAGVDPRLLAIGRLLVLGAAIGAALSMLGLAGVVVLRIAGADVDTLLRLVLMLTGYGVYLYVFLTITLGVSAFLPSTRGTLAALLAFWIGTSLLVPRIAPAVAADIHPSPSGPQLLVEIEQSLEREKQQLRQTQGLGLDRSEEISTEAFRRHFAALYRSYERQAVVQRAFALLSPRIALQSWSEGFAGTDFGAHRRFLDDAESYRYAFTQRLNREVERQRSAGNAAYIANVALLTADIGGFEPSLTPISDVVGRVMIDMLVLVLWGLAGTVFMLLGVVRMRLSA